MEELSEILELLRRSALEPELCDTPVPLSSCPVHAGLPTLPGDATADDYVLLPKSVVGLHPELFIPVIGDSMLGAGFCEGDRLRVCIGVEAADGDIVVASIDGECTVKALYTDDDGQRWLVPRNEAYDSIALTDEMDVRIIGRVVGVEKESPRISFRDCQREVRRTKNRLRHSLPLTAEQVDAAIRRVAPAVEHGRQWYAVYRALLDRQATPENDYHGFCRRVAALAPDHAHLPVAKEVGRMAVLSFRKPVALWERGDAPVSGVRFDDYLRIARLTGELLAG